MLQIIGYISLVLALGFGALLALLSLQNTKKKSLKVRKKIRTRRRVYGVAAGLFLILGLALQFATLPQAELKELISKESPVDLYTKAKSNVEKAYSTLPSEIFALGDDYYVRTENGKLYGHLLKNGAYEKGLVSKEAVQVTGGERLMATVTKKGRLTLTGAFEYLTYEKDDTYFNAKQYSKDCSFADATDNSLFYVEDGVLWSVGYNAFGKLGDGTTRNRLESAVILEDCASVSTSETHTLAVDIFGNLYGFGDNSYSEMGNRTTASSNTPEKLMNGVKQAEAGRYFSIVLTKNGEVYAAGRNDRGQLGTGDDRDYATYKKILDGVTKIAVYKNSCAALTAAGILYVWGDNSAHQLGAGEEIIRAPKQYSESVYDVAMGESSMGIITLGRDVLVTGDARPEKNNEFEQAVWAFGATVPEDKLYRETVVMPTRAE